MNKPKIKFTIHKPGNLTTKPLPKFNEWVEELESGRAIQGIDFLSKDEKECCLGVYCRLQQRPSDAGCYCVRYDSSETKICPPNPGFASLNASGVFPSPAYVLCGEERLRSLAECNDYGLGFAEIAQIIREFWHHEE